MLASCSPKPKTQKQEVSYTIGVQFGKNLKTQSLDLDMSALTLGIRDGLSGAKLYLTDQQMQDAMLQLSQERQKEMKAEAERNKTKSEEFLNRNKTAPGVQVTPSGLQYKIIEEGSGPSPKIDDTVVVNYKGSLIDGTEFDSSYKRKMSAEFPIKAIIPGWSEGLRLMKKGGKATLYIPPELGYGDRQRQQIPPNAVLIFDVELLDVKPSPKPPAAKAPTKRKNS